MTKVDHLEVLVEETSMEVALSSLLPRLLGEKISFRIHSHQGKPDLLKKLPQRLRGYRCWLTGSSRILVVIDRDNEDCEVLKHRLETAATASGLVTRTTRAEGGWQVVNRIAVEELEAWYLGDIEALRTVFPKISPNLGQQARYRDPDAVSGGTWETLEGILQRKGYFKGGLRKIDLARRIGPNLDPDRNRSHSFRVFRDVIREIAASA